MSFDIWNFSGVADEWDGRTDRHTDRRTERIAVSNSAVYNDPR